MQRKDGLVPIGEGDPRSLAPGAAQHCFMDRGGDGIPSFPKP